MVRVQLVGETRELRNIGCPGGPRLRDERVDLLVADVDAAKLVERKLVAGTQAQDLAVDQQIEALQLVREVPGHQPASG
ncbi:MAG: hypothetical protein WKG01_10020 [Kofleriaceae bacterium]